MRIFFILKILLISKTLFSQVISYEKNEFNLEGKIITKKIYKKCINNSENIDSIQQDKYLTKIINYFYDKEKMIGSETNEIKKINVLNSEWFFELDNRDDFWSKMLISFNKNDEIKYRVSGTSLTLQPANESTKSKNNWNQDGNTIYFQIYDPNRPEKSAFFTGILVSEDLIKGIGVTKYDMKFTMYRKN